MCGLPTETDEDVLQIAELASEVIETGREVTGTPRHPLHGVDRRVRAQAAHAVPVGGAARPRGDRRAAGQAARARSAPTARYGKAIGFRYHDGKPGIVEGLLSRGDRRVGAVIEAGVARRRPLRRLERALLLRALDALRRGGAAPASRSTSTGTPPASATQTEVLPWDHLDSGLDKDWLWEDWQDALAETEVDDCRWTPCFDCGVCPQMGTEIQVGPTGKTLLPLTVRRRRPRPAAGVPLTLGPMPASGPDPSVRRPPVARERTATSAAYVVRQATSADLPALTALRAAWGTSRRPRCR